MAWTVVHKEHDGTTINTIRPENLEFTLNKGEHGSHEISYEIARGHPLLTSNFIGPYRTDFLLKRGTTDIMGGPHTMVGVNTDEEHVKIAGRDWLHYTERRQWPFKGSAAPNDFRLGVPTTSIDDPPQGFAYHENRDVGLIINDVATMIMSRPNSLNMTWDSDPTGHTTKFAISIGDEQYFYDMLQTLSQEEPGNFDFWMTPAKHLHIIPGGRYSPPVWDDSSLAEHIFDKADPTSGLFEVSFTNTGPDMTHILGTGAGTATKLGVALGANANQEVFRRLDRAVDFGDVRDIARLERLTRNHFGVYLNPVHEITLTCIPDTITNFWTRFAPGKAIWLICDMDFHTVDSAQEIVSMKCNVDNEGNELVAFGLNQIYAPGSTVGILEG